MTISDNTGNLLYDGLISVGFDLDSCAYVRNTDQEVPHETAAEIITYGVLDAAVKNEGNVHKSRRRTTVATAQVPVVDKHLGTAWDQLQRFAVSWTVTKDMISSSAVPSTSAAVGTVPSLTVFGENTERNPSNFKREVIEVSAWQTLTTKAFDDELGIEYTLVESVVIPSATLPASTTTSWIVAQRQVDALRAIRSTWTLTSAYASLSYETIMYTFPALLAQFTNPSTFSVANGLVLGNAFEQINARSVFMIHVNTREAFSAPVLSRVYEEIITSAARDTLIAAANNAIAWGTGAANWAALAAGIAAGTSDLGGPSLKANLFLPKTRDISYSGLMFNLNVPNVLTDARTLVATSNSADTFYGYPVSETCTIYASNITATEYIALIGKIVCVEDSILQWKHGLWKRVRKFVEVQ